MTSLGCCSNRAVTFGLVRRRVSSRSGIGPRPTACWWRRRKVACCGTPAVRVTGRPAGYPWACREFFPYDQVGEDEYFDARLHEEGLELSDIDYVVLSHLHFDHAGNAQLFKGTDAKMVCSKDEHDFAFGFDGVFSGGHLKSDYDKLKWQTVDGDTELLPGVTLIQVPGHTPGTMAMRVDLPETGTMIFTSDAVFMGDTYGPPTTPGFLINDLTTWYPSVEKIRKLAEETNATLVFGHDSDQMTKLRTAPESYV